MPRFPILKSLFHHQLVHIAPEPIFAGFDGPHNRVLGSVKMLGSVLVLRGITATHVSANHAQAKMDPRVPLFQAFLASFAAGFHFLNFFDVRAAVYRHFIPPIGPRFLRCPSPKNSICPLDARVVPHSSSPWRFAAHATNPILLLHAFRPTDMGIAAFIIPVQLVHFAIDADSHARAKRTWDTNRIAEPQFAAVA